MTLAFDRAELLKGAEQRRHEQPPPPDISLNESDAGDDVELPKPRPWLLGNQFCRTFLSSLVAPGGTGKSALRYLQAISPATGRQLTGQFVFHRCRILVVSLEDDDDEMKRRFAAALIHHKIDRAEIKGWLFRAAPKGIKLAEIRNGSRQDGALEKALRDAIDRRPRDARSLREGSWARGER
jgi:hypothetical protein